ncbi:hypothetical protein BB934_45760 (plasmid) [Microvirga ossetica]|uniref:Uncharacterized protein n=1 Tax=Microvirga ossetica TaxID=1882682 RepID=A0A1B2F016_9HYPH|nr:hypothetical protein [Microvirga ossetica]ANY85528.1 hypothetical protein BB934_45760 [Microvirga ossetica]
MGDFEQAKRIKAIQDFFGLSPERANKVLAFAAAQGINVDDIYAISLFMNEGIIQVADDLPKKLDVQGKRNAALVAKTIDDKLAALPITITERLEGAGPLLAKSVEKAIEKADKREYRMDQRKMTGLIGGFALGGVMLAVVSAFGGYSVHDGHAIARTARAQMLADAPGADTLIALGQINDMDRTIRQQCTSETITVENGQRTCTVEVALDAPAVPGKGGAVSFSLMQWLEMVPIQRLFLFGLIGLVVAFMAGRFSPRKPRY